MFRVQFCDVRYSFRKKTMCGESFPPVIYRRLNVLFTLFVFASAQWCPPLFVQCPLFCSSSSCVLCTQCCKFLLIVHSLLPPSVFSNVYYFLVVFYITLNVQYYHLHYHGEVYSIKHEAIKFTNDLRQVGGFLPPIKLTPTV